MTNPYGYGPMGGMTPQGMMGHMPMMAPPPPPPGAAGSMNPATNNEPLQFNTNKGKAPLAVSSRSSSSKKVSLGEDMSGAGMELQDINPAMNTDMDLEQNENGQLQHGGGGMMHGWQPMMPGPMMGDPSMMMGHMGGPWGGHMAHMGPPMDMAAAHQQRQPITFKSCTLYPPPPNAPPPTTRERPPGCRTVFVGGLPENVSEEIVREVFDGCGRMTSLRVSKKKNFCHIRYEEEYSVDKALQVSGYRMKIENKDDKPNTGRLHVDYAQARDDLYEWECQQRALAREMRHRQRIEQERLRPPSPPPVIHFSDHEAQVLVERLKGDETFAVSSEVLITWMDRGDCNRRTSNQFYSMVQSVNSHIRRLTNEKASYNEEYEQMKMSFRQRLEGLLRQFEQIDKVFKAAGRQKAWDHFSKAQRKNIDTWRNQCQEIKSREEQEFLRERKEDEMEMSDSEESASTEPLAKKKRWAEKVDDGEMSRLKDENDSLKCQLEAYKNEVVVLKQDYKDSSKDEDNKDQQIRILQQTLKGMQQQLLSSKQDLSERETSLKQKLEEMEYDNDKLKRAHNETKKKLVFAKLKNAENASGDKEEATEVAEEKEEKAELPTSSSHSFTDREARLVGLISTFLHVHPFGASIDYIASYLAKLQMRVRTSELEDVLEMCPSVFKLDVIGVGASIEKRWKFIGFNPF